MSSETLVADRTLFVGALSGSPLLRLDGGTPLEAARTRVARSVDHFVEGTHLLDARTCKRLKTDDDLLRSDVCLVLLCESYRVECGTCGAAVDCACGLHGDRSQGCDCAPCAVRGREQCNECSRWNEDDDWEDAADVAPARAGQRRLRAGWLCDVCGRYPCHCTAVEP
jgi:hypothetical protein